MAALGKIPARRDEGAGELADPGQGGSSDGLVTPAGTNRWREQANAHHRRDGAFTGRRFFGGDEVGFLDVVLGCGSYWLAIFEEVTGVQLVDTEAFPFFHSWLRDFEAQGKVRETIPSMDRLLEYARPPPDAGHHGRRRRCRNGRGLGRRPTPAPPATAPPAATTADIAVDI
ncbi:hypothetical protein ZWY2020_014253 [Hordeum vulgare]|nr:hypothetical protein ZWY2020_014253 [Hordeum vulgare]